LLEQIGNAVINDETDQLGMVEYAWSHAIISDELHAAVTRECDSFREEADGGRPGKGCSPAVKAFMGAFDDIDIYSIYTPTCLASAASPAGNSSAARRPARLVAAPRLFSQHVRSSVSVSDSIFKMRAVIVEVSVLLWWRTNAGCMAHDEACAGGVRPVHGGVRDQVF
jgi:hypothetical protein